MVLPLGGASTGEIGHHRADTHDEGDARCTQLSTPCWRNDTDRVGGHRCAAACVEGASVDHEIGLWLLERIGQDHVWPGVIDR